jgi:serine/threonine protein kinase
MNKSASQVPQVVYAGKGSIHLTSKDYLASGGQGNIYARAGIAYKIYEFPTNMIPVGKMQELAVLSDPRIIKPDQILYDAKGIAIGYTMRHLENTHALVKLFPKAFRDRNHITPDQIIKLVRQMQGLVDHVHSHGILLVDLNQKNFLVDNKFSEVYAIDVDSFQTKSFPCPVQMSNIHDHHTKGFSKLTDYFAFGIVSFNLFIGSHPFLGNHPDYKFPVDEDTLKLRMQKNASVFDPKCQLPGVCQPMTVIPQSYLDWYKALFVDGKRVPPPFELQPLIVIVTPTIKRVQGTDNFDITELFTLPEEIIQYDHFDATAITLTKGGLYSSKRKLCGPTASDIGITPKLRYAIAASIDGGKLQLFNASANATVKCSIDAQQLMSYAGRIYTKQGGDIFEIEFIETSNLIPSVKQVATVHNKTGKMYDGVIFQSLMGKSVATIFPKPGEAREIYLADIVGEVVDAKYERNILMVVAVKGNEYTRYVFRFAPDSTYDVKVISNIVYSGFNFTVLDNGICCNMNEAEEIELFRNVKGDSMVKVVPDANIGSGMRLTNNGSQVLFVKGNAVYTLKMKVKP